MMVGGKYYETRVIDLDGEDVHVEITWEYTPDRDDEQGGYEIESIQFEDGFPEEDARRVLDIVWVDGPGDRLREVDYYEGEYGQGEL